VRMGGGEVGDRSLEAPSRSELEASPAHRARASAVITRLRAGSPLTDGCSPPGPRRLPVHPLIASRAGSAATGAANGPTLLPTTNTPAWGAGLGGGEAGQPLVCALAYFFHSR